MKFWEALKAVSEGKVVHNKDMDTTMRSSGNDLVVDYGRREERELHMYSATMNGWEIVREKFDPRTAKNGDRFQFCHSQTVCVFVGLCFDASFAYGNGGVLCHTCIHSEAYKA